MDLEEVKQRLSGLISESYVWPEIPAGWRLEFIAHSNTDVEMDLLHPVSASFWSDENEPLEIPIMTSGQALTATVLQRAGIPFMTPMNIASVSVQPPESHLAIVKGKES